MAQIFGTSAVANPTPSNPTPPVASLRVQTSIEGKPRAIFYGVTRAAANLIWYGDFVALTTSEQQQAQGGGGKGGGGSAAPTTTNAKTTYSAAVAMALGEGEIAGIGQIWNSKSLSSQAELNLGLLTGTTSQDPWSYLTAFHPEFALTYRRTAYVASGPMQLGSNPELPNLTFEVISGFVGESGLAEALQDANFADVLADFLGNAIYGVPGWQSAFNGDWSVARSYWQANALLLSVALTDQVTASDWANSVLEALNTDPVWSDKKLKLVPRGDAPIAAHNASYLPPAAPIYDLDDDDFLPNQASLGTGTNADPVSVVRTSPREQYNVLNVEYLERGNDYNPATLPARNDAAIRLYGERTKGTFTWHFLQTAAVAGQALQLALGREQIRNQYAFTLPPRFILLDPTDIVTITDVALGLLRQSVKILDIQENADRSLNFLVEEYLVGTGAAPLYGQQANTGYRPNYNADPGDINAPLIFEPTDEVAGGLQVWAAISGVDKSLYGGCDVYVSYDDLNYTFVGRQVGPARMGVLSNSLAAFSVNQTGVTIDDANTLSVDLSESAGQLISGSQTDALAFNTACYVDGEVLSYQTATLTGTNKYDLTYLVRGIFGTESAIVTHDSGKLFCRLDGAILKIPFDQSRIGATIFLKFVPFNIWGGGGKTLADVSAYTYKLMGSALASPLPIVQNLRAVFEAGFLKIWWDEVSDFRTGIRYIVKKGDTFQGAQQLGDLAHPPFIAFGAGKYWITAYCQPVAGLLVYSETPAEITVVGNMLVANLLTTIDFQAETWTGSFTNVAKEGVDPTAFLRLTGSSNILADPSVLPVPDILNEGGIELSGIWQSDQIFDIGYVAQCFVNASWLSTGLPIGQNVLTVADFLNDPDVLASASAAFVNVWIEIRFATVIDIITGVQWSDWQRFVPGVYQAQFIQFRAAFETVDSNIIAYLLGFTADVSLPPRIDHYLGNTVPIGGLTIPFEPDDAISAFPFNGGPRVGGNNNHPLPSPSFDWAGHPEVNVVIDSLTLAQLVFHFEDGSGTHVQVTGVDIVVEGF